MIEVPLKHECQLPKMPMRWQLTECPECGRRWVSTDDQPYANVFVSYGIWKRVRWYHRGWHRLIDEAKARGESLEPRAAFPDPVAKPPPEFGPGSRPV